MKRRTFLAALGLAPVAAALGAQKALSSARPSILDSSRIYIDQARIGTLRAEGIFRAETTSSASGATAGIGISAVAPDGQRRATLFIDAEDAGPQLIALKADRFDLVEQSDVQGFVVLREREGGQS